MASPASIADLDLRPLPGKTYRNFDRDFSEEFIYFLLVDRFQDSRPRTADAGKTQRSAGSGDAVRLGDFCGGTLRGVRENLDYIAGLGCTAIWLSPVFGNNPHAYHGYAIQNYLDIEPRFGTKQDLIDLVDEAHRREMRVILDVVINHSGDNWSYRPDVAFYYYRDLQFPFGSFRPDRMPVPTELQNADYYHRRGQILNWDASPEAQNGDFYGSKDFNNDMEDPANAAAAELVNVLVQAHCYWIREADVDAFRVDAVKHMGPVAVSRFASGVREYAEGIGKRSFAVFGELIAQDDAINRYIGPNTPTGGGSQVYFGLDSVLDFPLHFILPAVLKGMAPPPTLFARYDAMRQRALSRGQLGRYLVTFLDNHDQVGQSPRRRFGSGTPEEQIIAGVGYLLCALGTPCIYYGTEQGFSGSGASDSLIREAMFDLDDPARSLLNASCRIYREIAALAQVFREQNPLRFGRIYFRPVSGNGLEFGLPQGHPCTIAFSRILANDEVLVAYNTSTSEARSDFVLIDPALHRAGDKLASLYGGLGPVTVETRGTPSGPIRCVRLDLQPMQFVILR